LPDKLAGMRGQFMRDINPNKKASLHSVLRKLMVEVHVSEAELARNTATNFASNFIGRNTLAPWCVFSTSREFFFGDN